MTVPAGWPGTALASLPVLRRQVFLLRVRDGLPLAAVAARTGLTNAQAGALLVLACRTVAPPGALGPDWVLEARTLLRAESAADAGPEPAARARAWQLPAGLALVVAAAAGGWWLRDGAAPEESAVAAQRASARVEAPALTAAEAALAAPDLALLQLAQQERELLESFEFYRWLAEQHDGR